MMQTNLPMTFAILFVASTMAFGQTIDDPQSKPALPGQPDAEAADQAVDTIDPATETEIVDLASIAGLIEVQAEGQHLASDLLGSDVADRAGEAVGEVSDLIFDQEDRLVGAVIATGGFLGIGKREVGVEIAQLRRNTDRDLYVFDWSQAEVAAAPAFLTLADQEAEREAELLRQQQLEQLDQQQAPADTNQLQ